VDDGEWDDLPRWRVEVLIMKRQGLPQGYYIPDNFENNFVEVSDTVLLYSPTQRPGPLSYMVSSEAF